MAVSHLDVFRQVNDDRTGTSGAGDVESLLDDAGQIVDILDQVIMLGNRSGNTDEVGLLEGIIANQSGGDLPGNDHHRDRIHVGVGDPGNRIGGTGTAGCDGDTDLAGRTRVTIGGMHCSLLMTGQDMLDRRPHQVIININDRTTGITKDRIDAFLNQALQKNFRTSHFHFITPQTNRQQRFEL